MKQNFSPHDLLPVAEPKTRSPNPYDFYDKVAKYFVTDMVRIMINGLPIDLNRVRELEIEVTTILKNIEKRFQNNKLVLDYQIKQYSIDIDSYIEERKAKQRDYNYYLKPFNYKSMEHRSYFMDLFSKDWKLPSPKNRLPTGVSKWTVKDVKKFSDKIPVLKRLLDGELHTNNNKYVRDTIKEIAETKAEIYNKKFVMDKQEIKKEALVKYPIFNPSSSLQKRDLFKGIGIISETISPKGNESFNRQEIERINKETSNEEVKDLTQILIDYSFSAIIKSNFIKAFYNNTVEGRLFGNYKLFGAKTFRLSSNGP